MAKISPSSNPEREENLVNYVLELQSMGADFMHMDVMDGKFVENTCLSHEIVKNVDSSCDIPLDVHLMVENPRYHIPRYIEAGADIVTIHYESYENITDLIDDINLIKSNGVRAGISINPATPVSSISTILSMVDMVLVMSVVPGKSGQKFIESSLDKIRELKDLIDENEYSITIEVDGGVNLENASSIVSSGADMLVMGSALYKAENRKFVIDTIHSL